MSKGVVKLSYKHPNFKKTSASNINYLNYIGTREGVVLNDDLENRDINGESNNEEYIKYIQNRTRSHGLFNNYNDVDLKDIRKEIRECNGFVYRMIVSLREGDAIANGFDEKEKWKELINSQIGVIAKQLSIPKSQIKWVGAFHRESGHPHVHLMLWNSKDEIRNYGYIDTKNLESIRKNLTDEIFKDVRVEILNEKNLLRDILLEKTNFIVNDNMFNEEELINLKDKYNEAKQELELLDEVNSYELGCRVTDKDIEIIKSMIEKLRVPLNGRLQYKLMPQDAKEHIDEITKRIVKRPNYIRYYNDYLNSVERLTRLYTESPDQINKSIKNAEKDLYSRIGNKILKSIKDIKVNNKSEDYCIQNLLINIVKIISIKTNQQENEQKVFTYSKAEIKEKVKENKAKGLFSELDFI